MNALSKEDLEAIRVDVANEPEGSPARRLLAEIDRRDEELHRERRLRNKHAVMQMWGYTEEEAERVVSFIEGGGKLVEEEVPCWSCGGDGEVVTEMGCFGPKSWGRCSQCYGKRKAKRQAVPKPEPTLPVNPARTYPGYGSEPL